MHSISIKMEKEIFVFHLTLVILVLVKGYSASVIVKELDVYDSITDEYINKINSLQNSWTAGYNFPPGTKFEDLTILAGTKEGRLPEMKDEDIPSNVQIPKSFDARKKWPKCKSIKEIKNQGHCGSCWAVSSATTMSDRLCISSNGKFNDDISAQHITSCSPASGCHGGWPSDAWQYFVDNGAPTGGDFNSNKGCQPYLVEPCVNRTGDTIGDLKKPKVCEKSDYVDTPVCQIVCYNKKYHKGFTKDLHHGKNVYSLPNDVQKIQMDILKYGPVVAVFGVYDDFYTYKSGVYKSIRGRYCGLHAVRIIGWGEENGKDYWLIANQWGKEFGNKGLIKFLRGENECGIESNVVSGITGTI